MTNEYEVKGHITTCTRFESQGISYFYAHGVELDLLIFFCKYNQFRLTFTYYLDQHNKDNGCFI